MPSAVSDYFFALKSKYYDNMSDYDRGSLHGIVQTSVAFLGVELAFGLVKMYRM